MAIFSGASSVAFWALCLLRASNAVVSLASTRPAATHDLGEHDLGYDGSGKLVFTQLEASRRSSRSKEALGRTGGGLYAVQVNLDIETMRASSGVTVTFDKVNHVMRMDAGIATIDGIAWGRYIDQINVNGWSELYVDTTSSNEVSNDVRMYAAGFIEGLLTCVRMSEYYSNTHKLLLRTEPVSHAVMNLKALFQNQIGFMKAQANLFPHIMAEQPKDPYWAQARYILFQLWGICDGYNYAAKHFGTHHLQLEDMLVLNTGSELPNLIAAYTPKAISDRAKAATFAALTLLQKSSSSRMRKASQAAIARKLGVEVPASNVTEDPLDDAHWEKRLRETGHCSAFIRVAEENKDIFVGHTTWDDYSKMTRIFKYYNFPLDGASTMAHKIAFSSYPGLITSTDDFYVMSSGLTVMDTTLTLLNPFLWDKVLDFPATPHIPNFAHLMITNRLAKNGAHWTRLFATQNTGTYAAQWMVVDYNRYIHGKTLRDDTFWMLEAIPGMARSEDMTFFLREHGFWPSMNRPYFDDIREETGHTGAQRSHGKLYSWFNNPRAEIFRGAAGSVNSLLEMRMVMNRNLWPFSGVLPAEPSHEIAARNDLAASMQFPNGGIDSKVISRCLFQSMNVQAISGPSHMALPAFEWLNPDGAEKFPGYPHVGLPNKWNFDWVQMTPLDPGALSDVMVC